ncbi:MAG: hypothetical protein WDM90_16185 [Ferruginibacter sp.]
MTSFIYFPNEGISLNQIKIYWGDYRFDIQQLLHNKHSKSDSVSKRDIYYNFNGEENYFFLNYDEKNLLIEVEIHNGILISINNILLKFGTDFQTAVSLLKNVSADNVETSAGEYLFKDLKLTISNSESMGGEGDNLAYFYCSKE